MNLKKYLFAGVLLTWLLPAHAAENRVPLPVIVAESEAFEIVGRLDENSLLLHVDRAPTNAPVLNATLLVEAGGKEIAAAFDAAAGAYRIADAAWLQPLRAAGGHSLSFTLVAGDEADLLAGELLVDGAAQMDGQTPWLLSPLASGALLGGFGLLVAGFGWRRFKQRRGGAA